MIATSNNSTGDVRNNIPDSSEIASEPVYTSDQAGAATTAFRGEVRVVTSNLVVDPAYSISRDPGSSIAEFMRKPYEIFSGTWTTADVATTQLTTALVESYLTSVTQWANKLQGFENVRGTAVLRLVLNASPFQQGRLIMTFVPCSASISTNSWRNRNLTSATQLPNVEIDCRDGDGILKIPYIAPTDWYNLKNAGIGWGRFTVTVLSDLFTGAAGETSAFYSLYLYFEDFELSAPLVAQSGSNARIEKIGKKSAEYKEQASISSGSLSKAFNTIGTSLNVIGSKVPLVSSITSTAAWVANGVANSLSWFGFSKPRNDKPPIITSQLRIPFMANSTGVSMAPKLALRHDNAQDIIDISPVNCDEMSFAYLKSIPAYVDEWNLVTTDVAGSSIRDFDISPFFGTQDYTVVNGGHTARVLPLAPVGYIASGFRCWRGSLKLKIKFIKTVFHTGRIMITFTPTTHYTTAPTIQTSILSIREIVDVGLTDEHEFVLPYMLPFEWIDSFVAANNSFASSLGHINVVTLNPLRCPETCANSVQVLVYLSGGDDFEVMAPSYTRIPGFGSSPAIIAQSGDTIGAVGASVDPIPHKLESLANVSSDNPSNYGPQRMAGGEVFTSIKQIFTKYTGCFMGSSGTAVVTDTSGTCHLAPFKFGLPVYTAGSGVTFPTVMLDFMSELVSGFAFYRGGIRVAISPNDAAALSRPIATAINYNTSPTTFSCGSGVTSTLGLSYGVNFLPSVTTLFDAASVNIYNDLAQFHNGAVGIADVEIPYYSAYRMSLVDPARLTYGNTDPPIGLDVRFSGTTSAINMFTTRAGAEDFQVSYFIGFPPRLISYS
jgi:hypothetical protein